MNLRSDIIINGKVTTGYKIKRGVKQGDALSCILFILCIEPLIKNVEINPNIEAVFSPSLSAFMPKAYAYADDVTGTFKKTASGLQAFFTEYERLTRLSGLELNADKTDVLKSNKQKDDRDEQLEVEYLGSRHKLKNKSIIKLNGVFLQQDNEEMKNKNVEEVGKRMDKNFKLWSRRNLSTLGKILIAKTFGISQAIYLMQSMKLENCHFKKLNAILYKFIWNRRYLAAKAPERIKREITNTPIKMGGLGMLDLKELDESLKLRAVGRIFVTNHPLLVKVKGKFALDDFFYPACSTPLDEVATLGLDLLGQARRRSWSDDRRIQEVRYVRLLKSVNIASIVGDNGKRSIPYFLLNRAGKRKVADLVPREWRTIRNYVKTEPRNLFDRVINLNIGISVVEDRYLFPCRTGLKNLQSMTSKEIREELKIKEPICLFKLGLILTPTESFNWLDKVNKLTCTKLKNSVLRAAHGDIYCEERLFRFGLVDSPLCANCNQIDTLQHKIYECPTAREIWELTLEATDKLRPTLTRAPNEEYLQRIMAACSDTNRTIVTIHAEILSRIISPAPNKPPPRIMLQSVLLSTLSKEKEESIKKAIRDLLSAYYAF